MTITDRLRTWSSAMKSVLKSLTVNKSIIIEMAALNIAIIALIISLIALNISRRQLDVSDPASSVYISNIYMDVSHRLLNITMGKESYDYPLVVEIFNTGNQPLIITGFSIKHRNPSFKPSDDFINRSYSPRKYFFADNLQAINPSKILPVIVQPTKKTLLLSSNPIRINLISDYVSKFDTTKVIIHEPADNSDTSLLITGWESEEDISVASLNNFITDAFGSEQITLNLSFLNSKDLFSMSIPLNEGSNGLDNKSDTRINFKQLLLDEILIADIKFIISRDSLLYPLTVKSVDTMGIHKDIKSSRPDVEKMDLSLGPILHKMGYDDHILNYHLGGGFFVKEWNPLKKR